MLSSPNAAKSAKLVGVSADEAKNTDVLVLVEFTTVMPNGVLKTSIRGVDMDIERKGADITWNYVRNCDGKEYSGVVSNTMMEKHGDGPSDMYKGAVIIEFSRE